MTQTLVATIPIAMCPQRHRK